MMCVINQFLASPGSAPLCIKWVGEKETLVASDVSLGIWE